MRWQQSESANLQPIRVPRWLLMFLCIWSLAMLGYYVGIKGSRRSAFVRWQPQIHALLAGENIYAKYAFPTPPIMALILVPFATLPTTTGMTLWFVVKLGLTAWAGWLILNALVPNSVRERKLSWLQRMVAGVGLLCVLEPIGGDLQHGNVNLWIFFLVTYSWHCYLHGRDRQAGIWLSLAAACKLTPIILLGYFVINRNARVLIWFAIGTLAWLIVVPGMALGFSQNFTLLEHWYRQMIEPFAIRGAVEVEVTNQSLVGLVSRWVSSSEFASPRMIVMTLIAALLANLAYLGIKANDLPRNSSGQMNLFACYLLSMLLLSERSWKHHYVHATIPVLLVTLQIVIRPTLVAWMVLIVHSCVLLGCSTDVMEALGNRDWAKQIQSAGGYALSGSMILIFLSYQTWRSSRRLDRHQLHRAQSIAHRQQLVLNPGSTS